MLRVKKKRMSTNMCGPKINSEMIVRSQIRNTCRKMTPIMHQNDAHHACHQATSVDTLSPDVYILRTLYFFPTKPSTTKMIHGSQALSGNNSINLSPFLPTLPRLLHSFCFLEILFRHYFPLPHLPVSASGLVALQTPD